MKIEGPIRRNPRWLLEAIVKPVLIAVAGGVERAPINMGLPIDPQAPRDLDALSGRYLGGWEERSKQRLNYLLYYWTGFETLGQGISALEPLREPLRLPQFSQSPPKKPEEEPRVKDEPITKTRRPDIPEPQEYKRLFALLENWSGNNEPLRQDARFRELLLPLIKNSVPWNELRRPAEPARARVSDQNTTVVEIEGMVAKPSFGGMRFQFPRSDKSAGLLRASLRFRLLGGNSWQYKDFVPDRRLIGRWCLSGKPA